jgi:hypothetical protein
MGRIEHLCSCSPPAAALDDVLGARGTDLKAVRFDLAREVEGLLKDFLAHGYGLVQ